MWQRIRTAIVLVIIVGIAMFASQNDLLSKHPPFNVILVQNIPVSPERAQF